MANRAGSVRRRVGEWLSSVGARLAGTAAATAQSVPAVELSREVEPGQADAQVRDPLIAAIGQQAWDRHRAAGAPEDWLRRVAAQAPGLLQRDSDEVRFASATSDWSPEAHSPTPNVPASAHQPGAMTASAEPSKASVPVDDRARAALVSAARLATATPRVHQRSESQPDATLRAVPASRDSSARTPSPATTKEATSVARSPTNLAETSHTVTTERESPTIDTARDQRGTSSSARIEPAQRARQDVAARGSASVSATLTIASRVRIARFDGGVDRPELAPHADRAPTADRATPWNSIRWHFSRLRSTVSPARLKPPRGERLPDWAELSQRAYVPRVRADNSHPAVAASQRLSSQSRPLPQRAAAGDTHSPGARPGFDERWPPLDFGAGIDTTTAWVEARRQAADIRRLDAEQKGLAWSAPPF